MSVRTAAIALLALVVVAPSAEATRTRSWRETPADLAKGESDGIAISRYGELAIAPAMTELDTTRLRERPAQLWDLVRDDQGVTWAATGPDGQILRVDRVGAPSLAARLPEPLVTALAIDGVGLLAAGAPGGRIYRIGADGEARLFAESGHPYVWDLAVDRSGRLLAAVGGPAAVLRIDNGGKVSPLYEPGERHVMSLLPLDDGHVVAGTAPNGRVYQIDPAGHAIVLHDDDLPEATALHRGADGAIYVGLIAKARSEPERPSVTINLADAGGGERGASPLATDRVDVERSELRGVIEGLTDEQTKPSRTVRGRLVRIAPDGSSSTLWRSSGAALLTLFDDGGGRTLFGTGEPARLYRVERGTVALLHTLPAAQTSAAVGATGRAIVGTSNPLRLFRVDDRASDEGVFASRVFDAGAPARWGSVSWRVEGQRAGRAEIYTRTGNSARPDETWSGWSPALTQASGSPIINPDGRFAQWRLRVTGADSDGLRVADVTVRFATINRPPSLKDLDVEGQPDAVDDEALVSWSARDPDDDRVDVRFEFRAAQSAEWSALPPDAPAPFPDAARSGWREDQFRWETASLADGFYELRAHASDASANAPGEGFEVEHPRRLRFAVDHTPPSIELARSGDRYELVVRDALSAIERVQVIVDGRALYTLRPEDGVTDSPGERFQLALDALPEAGWRIRAIDAAGNSAEAQP